MSKKKTTRILNESEKQDVLSNSYIGKKGYTIKKSGLTVDEIKFLKEDLMMRPFVVGQKFAQMEAAVFPVYRENENKFYVPRFYGIERYGIPSDYELNSGENIDTPFTKSLRDYQENIVQVYLNHVSSGNGGGILEVPCGRGKTVLALNIISKSKDLHKIETTLLFSC